MKKLMIALALAASLSACATSSPENATNAVASAPLSAVDRAEAAYVRWLPLAQVAIALLPAERQPWARAALESIPAWLAIARSATTEAERVAALRQAAGAMAVATSGAQPPS
jgi:hypothetical protein